MKPMEPVNYSIRGREVALLVVVALVAVAQVACAFKKVEPYERMEDYLKKRVLSDDPDSNMFKLRQWLYQLQEPRKKGCLFGSKAKVSEMVEPLKMVTSLDDIKPGKEAEVCKQSHLESLRLMALETGAGQPYTNVPKDETLPKESTKWRLIYLVRHYALEHARLCLPRYLGEFEMALRRLDREDLRHVILLSNQAIQSMGTNFDQADGQFASKALESLVQFSSGDPTAEWLQSALKGEQDREEHSKHLVNPCPSCLRVRLDKLYKEYLLDPCTWYLVELEDVFAGYDYDTKVLQVALDDGQGSADISNPASEDEKFLQHRSRYNFCNSLVFGKLHENLFTKMLHLLD